MEPIPFGTPFAGDITGAPGAITVTQLQSRAVSSAAPASGQALVWTGSSWTPQTIQSGSGSNGATMADQLGDLTVVRNSANTLNIGAACSTTTPCNVRFGSVVYTFTSPATATVTSGSGLAYIYISSAGILTVGQNLTMTCSASCTALPVLRAFRRIQFRSPVGAR